MVLLQGLALSETVELPESLLMVVPVPAPNICRPRWHDRVVRGIIGPLEFVVDEKRMNILRIEPERWRVAPALIRHSRS